jgi:starch synthase
MRILHGTAEYFGLAKTGGLADMVAASSDMLASSGMDIRVCLPSYRGCREKLVNARDIHSLNVQGNIFTIVEGQLGTEEQQVEPSLEQKHTPVIWLFDCPALFDREGDPYRDTEGEEFEDNVYRFGCFSEAIARMAINFPVWRPDIVHLHDWHVGLAACWISADFSLSSFSSRVSRPKIVFTIHNLAYQGIFSQETFAALGLQKSLDHYQAIEFYGNFSCMKAGINFSDVITVVSHTYAREIQTKEYGCGLDGVLRERRNVLHGIVNGMDNNLWNPEKDVFLVQKYSLKSVTPGKQINRRLMKQKLGLPDNEQPLWVFIGRMVEQKGADLILAAEKELMQLPVQWVILGAGDHWLEQAFRDLAKRYPERVVTIIGFDEALSHQLVAAADFQLMPSRYEPCGLSQLYAQRYGTIPVAHCTGGLSDTIVDATGENIKKSIATGVHFFASDAEAMTKAIQRSLELFNDQTVRLTLRQSGMRQDFSWEKSVLKYINLYETL